MDVYNLHGLWLTLIQPGFTDDEVVHQQLVKIKLSRFASLNEELRTMEANGTRNAKRAGVYLADEYFGLIITDMTPCKNPASHTHFNIAKCFSGSRQ